MTTYRIRLVCEQGPEPLSGVVLDHEEEVLEVDAVTPWQAYRRATMRMTISPSGRLLRGYDADSGEEIRPPENSELFRRSRFVIDTLQGPYKGYTRGETWNGWGVPLFEFEAAQQIAADLAREGEGDDGERATARYVEEDDAFVFRDSVNEDDVYYDAQVIAVEGREVKVYPIGTREWTWEEVDR